ncbi:MAG: response regulator [Patescibacteria group bacterium]|nr:response regulator [Patescibacteria group bacterium]
MSKARILIVEDEPSLQSALKNKMEVEGFDVETAKNGLEGVEAVKRSVPDLILLDMVMPVMDGLTMLKNIRESESSKNVPVIILSNLSDSQELVKAMQTETFDYLIKSDVSLEEIIGKVNDKLDPSIGGLEEVVDKVNQELGHTE